MSTPGKSALKPARLLALLPALIAACGVCVIYGDLDSEVDTCKHYNKHDFFYGGYGRSVYHCADGYKLQHIEAQANAANAALMTQTRKAPRFHGAHDGGGRLLCGSFLPSLVWRLSLGQGDIKLIYKATGIVLYLLMTAAAFALARLYFESHYAGCAAAFLCAIYPLHWVCFNQIKVQDGFLLLLLVELLVLELLLRSNCRLSVRFIVLTCAIFLGGFAMPANYMLATALAVRFLFALFTKSQRGDVPKLLVPVAALVAAMLLVSEFRESHQFSMKFWSIDEQVRATRESLPRFLHSHDWHDLRIMKYSVEQFTFFLKVAGDGIWRTNPVLLVFLVIFPFVSRRLWWLWVSAFPILVMGHIMTLVSGWIYHYGYMTGAGMMLAIVLIGGVSGAAMETGWATRRRTKTAVAAAALVAASLSFERSIDLYIGNRGWYDTDKDIYAIHGQCVRRIY